MSEIVDPTEEFVFNDLDDEDHFDDWDYEDNSLLFFKDKDHKLSIRYNPGQWNDSGMDPPSYSITYGKYWALLEFNRTRVYAPFLNNKTLTIEYGLKLSDFVKIVKSPFPLELSDGEMGSFFEDDFKIKDIVIEVNYEDLTDRFERFKELMVFI